jgi:glycosyltransferase involved in cell wall biosynthesis
LRVLFLTQYPEDGPSSRFRVYQYIGELQKQGIVCSVSPLITSDLYWAMYLEHQQLKYNLVEAGTAVAKRLCCLPLVVRYDVVFVQKLPLPFASGVFVRAMRRLNDNVVFDFDEALYVRRETEAREVVRASKCVVVGNDHLRDFARRYNRRVTVIPTPIDTRHYTPTAIGEHESRRPDVVTIGWMGTSHQLKYLEGMEDVLASLGKSCRIRLKVVSNGQPKFKLFADYVFIPWRRQEELRDLWSFDIGIMPLNDDEVSRGKCGFKLLQYMAMGRPCVASPIGVNTQMIQHGVNGFLAGTKQEWRDRLYTLASSKSLRQTMGRAGRRIVCDSYSLDQMTPKLEAVLRQVGRAPGGSGMPCPSGPGQTDT